MTPAVDALTTPYHGFSPSAGRPRRRENGREVGIAERIRARLKRDGPVRRALRRHRRDRQGPARSLASSERSRRGGGSRGASSDLHERRADRPDHQVPEAVLGQATDAASGGRAVARERRPVQEDIQRSDARSLSAILNRDLVRSCVLSSGGREMPPRASPWPGPGGRTSRSSPRAWAPSRRSASGSRSGRSATRSGSSSRRPTRSLQPRRRPRRPRPGTGSGRRPGQTGAQRGLGEKRPEHPEPGRVSRGPPRVRFGGAPSGGPRRGRGPGLRQGRRDRGVLGAFRRAVRELTDRLGWPGKAGQGSEKSFAWRTRVMHRATMRTIVMAGGCGSWRAAASSGCIAVRARSSHASSTWPGTPERWPPIARSEPPAASPMAEAAAVARTRLPRAKRGGVGARPGQRLGRGPAQDEGHLVAARRLRRPDGLVPGRARAA